MLKNRVTQIGQLMDTWIRAQAVRQRNSSQPHSLAKWCHYQCCTVALEEGQSSSSQSTGCCLWSDNELWRGARRICSDSAHRARALEHSVNHWVEACRDASIRQFVHVHTHNSQSPDCNSPGETFAGGTLYSMTTGLSIHWKRCMR